MNQSEESSLSDQSDAAFEHQLRQALRPVAPPEGFAERVMARAQGSTAAPAKVVAMPRPRVWVSGSVAAAVLTGVFFAEQVQVRHQRAEAEVAQRQFEAGMRVTDRALEHTREQLQRAGIWIGN